MKSTTRQEWTLPAKSDRIRLPLSFRVFFLYSYQFSFLHNVLLRPQRRSRSPETSATAPPNSTRISPSGEMSTPERSPSATTTAHALVPTSSDSSWSSSSDRVWFRSSTYSDRLPSLRRTKWSWRCMAVWRKNHRQHGLSNESHSNDRTGFGFRDADDVRNGTKTQQNFLFENSNVSTPSHGGTVGTMTR